jgi:hypothetical protein
MPAQAVLPPAAIPQKNDAAVAVVAVAEAASQALPPSKKSRHNPPKLPMTQ